MLLWKKKRTWDSSRMVAFRHGGQKSSLWGGNGDRGQAREGEQGNFSKKTEDICRSLRQEIGMFKETQSKANVVRGTQ